MHQYVLGPPGRKEALAENALEILVETKMNISQQHALVAKAANSILGCIRQGTGSGLRKVFFPLCSGLVRPYLESCVQFWAHQYETSVNVLERV